MNAWVWLLTAGAAEVAWSQSIKATAGFIKPLPTLACLALAAAAIYRSPGPCSTPPSGTAYTVFTGIGLTGAVLLGILLSGDPVTIPGSAESPSSWPTLSSCNTYPPSPEHETGVTADFTRRISPG